MADDKKEKKKKKKESVNINLPKARASLKRQNEVSQMKSDYNSLWSAIGIVLVVLVILFIILGGVNQKALIDWIFEWSGKVGNTISGWLSSGEIIQNENGIYWKP